MPIGSGLSASLGVAPETTYGTYVAPSRFLEFDSEDLKKVRNFVQGGGLAGGRAAQLASRRAFITEAAAGSIAMDFTDKSMGLVLAHILGGTPTVAQQAASAAYLQTHAFGDNVGKSLTVQEGVADRGGVTRTQTFKGGKITAAEFSCAVNELLKVSLEMDFQRFSEVEGLAAPSYPAIPPQPFHFGQLAVKLGTTSGSEAAVQGVTGVTCRIERPQQTDAFYAGATIPGTKAEPVWSGWGAVTGTVSIDYVNKADFVDRFHGDTQAAMVLEWTGPIIASTYAKRFTIKLPATFFTGDTPVVDSADVTDVSVPFEVQLDGTNPLVTCEYMSVDTAI